MVDEYMELLRQKDALIANLRSVIHGREKALDDATMALDDADRENVDLCDRVDELEREVKGLKYQLDHEY